MADYVAETRIKKRRKWPKRLFWLIVILLCIAGLIYGALYIRNMLKPNTVIQQAKPIETKVTFEETKTKYNLPNFTIEIPKEWKQMPRQPSSYTTYTWQTSDSGTDGQIITIYEDKIPTNFAVNKVQIVRGEGDHIAQDGGASDNCSKYTKGANLPNQTGTPAKWQDVEFLCDQRNKQRDVIGTSSKDGINTVVVTGPTAGTHKYFITYSNFNVANPDYAPFQAAISSFRMK